MSRRLNLSVLGSYSANEAEHQLADELGEGLASMKLNVVSGGQEGVMYSLCKAIHTHRRNGAEGAYIGATPGNPGKPSNWPHRIIEADSNATICGVVVFKGEVV